MTIEIASVSQPSRKSTAVWPFPTTTLPLGAMKITFTDVGRGAPLLFVHTGFSSFPWREVVERMRGGYRCLCVDAPGTTPNAHVPLAEVTLENSARAIVALIDTLDLSGITLVMHDLGGIAALAAPARRRNRIHALAAINTFGWKPHGKLRAMLAVAGSRLVTEIDVRTRIISRLTASAFGTGRRSERAMRDTVRRTLGSDALRAFHQYMRDARRADAIYEEIASALDGSLRNLPLLTIFGEKNDPFEFQRTWKALFPAAWQVVVRNGNHFPMCDDPDLVAQTLDAFYRASLEN
jgi:pimeloyl-ACP methyl ester carboxylesterase